MAESEPKPMEVDKDTQDTADDKKKDDKKEGKIEAAVAELSEEDKLLKETLEGYVEKLDDAGSAKDVLTKMRESITTSTRTMTSVPKPLKFLRPHFDTIKKAFESIIDADTKKICADVVSLLSMTQESEERECLKYRLLGTDDPIESFGHEYVRHLTGEIGADYNERITSADASKKDVSDLLKLVKQIVPYDMKHNAEAEACDLAMEVDQLGLVEEHVDAKAFSRVCLYLLSCVPFVPEPQDDELKHCCLRIFRKFDQYPQAMQMALKINDIDIIQEVFMSAEDMYMRRQLAFMLARQQVVLDLEELLEDDPDVDELISIMSNQKLNENFLALARELDIMEPKSPEDVYKTHLEAAGRSTAASIDSARANLASTFVNGFVNAGFGQDKLILNNAAGNKPWITARNKADRSQFSATASLGMILMWDGDGGLQKIDQYMLSGLDYVKGGSLLAVGIIFASVADDNDPARAILDEYVMHDKMLFRVGACMGLGLAYAGSKKRDVGDRLLQALVDPKSNMEVIGVTAVALGQIFVGTSDGEYTEAIITLLGEKTKEELATRHGKLAALGLGLLYLGKQAEAEVAMQTLITLDESFQKVAKMVLDTCAYAGTGDVLKIQSLLHACSEHVDTEKESFVEGDESYQAFATLGVALVSMGEETGVEMVMRMFNHLLRYGEPVIRRAVPLAIALLCTSNPKLTVLDTLSKLSHDSDAATAHAAILAIGIVGGGTNHARIANMLRLLAQYYNKDPPTVFVVRLAQGIVHAGKGSITFSPFHTERTLMSPVAVSGLLATLVSAMDISEGINKESHFMMYHLALAMYPRIFCTFSDDEDLTPVNTSVRVGQAVDVVGQAGSPKTITGFVTNNTPVLLGFGERAQLATDEYLPLTPLLEGFVILKKNPDFEG